MKTGAVDPGLRQALGITTGSAVFLRRAVRRCIGFPPEWQTKITRINVKASARVFSKWKSMGFYCAPGERSGAAIRAPLLHPFPRRTASPSPPPLFLSRIYAAFLSENAAFVSRARRVLERSKSYSAPASLLYGLPEPVFAWYKRVIRGRFARLAPETSLTPTANFLD